MQRTIKTVSSQLIDEIYAKYPRGEKIRTVINEVMRQLGGSENFSVYFHSEFVFVSPKGEGLEKNIFAVNLSSGDVYPTGVSVNYQE